MFERRLLLILEVSSPLSLSPTFLGCQICDVLVQSCLSVAKERRERNLNVRRTVLRGEQKERGLSVELEIADCFSRFTVISLDGLLTLDVFIDDAVFAFDALALSATLETRPRVYLSGER